MKLERKKEYDCAYMNMAFCMGQLSYARRNKVGCIILSKEGQVISQGFNGTPSGMDNNCEYEDENGNLVTKPEVLHAESNAIAKCAKWLNTTEGGTLYVTLSPCVNCAKLIIQSGIKRVCYKEEYRDATGIEFLRNNGIIVDKI